MFGVNSRNHGKQVPATAGGGGREVGVGGWELRPCGMLVQKRNSDVNQTQVVVPTIKVKVKYGSSYHEVNIKSQATFGELKKMLGGATGLNPLDQKLVFKDKERDSKAYLDVAGVKDGSRMALFDNILSREKRLAQNLKTTKNDKPKKEMVEITMEIDKLANQVGNLEREIYGGKKVLEKVVLNLIELLMSQLIKLDGIVAEGDVKLQRRMQVKRVQRYIEILDSFKIPGNGEGGRISFEQKLVATMTMEKQRDSFKWPIVATTQWEKF